MSAVTTLYAAEHQHVRAEKGIVLPMVTYPDFHSARLLAGEPLRIHTETEQGVVMTYLSHYGKVIGRLDPSICLDHPCRWEASIVDLGRQSVRLMPAELRSCGCIVRSNGQPVRMCRDCEDRQNALYAPYGAGVSAAEQDAADRREYLDSQGI